MSENANVEGLGGVEGSPEERLRPSPVRSILLTGFEPFAAESINASWEAVRRLDDWRHGDFQVVAMKLPCEYGASVHALLAAAERLRPAAMLMTGQAARRSVIAVERFGRRSAGAMAPDNRGVVPAQCRSDGPSCLETPTPVGRIVRAVRDAGAPARASTDAGNYVCNHLYYGVLLGLRKKGSRIPALFLHLPATPEQSPAHASPVRLKTHLAVRALKATIRTMTAALLEASESDRRREARSDRYSHSTDSP